MTEQGSSRDNLRTGNRSGRSRSRRRPTPEIPQRKHFHSTESTGNFESNLNQLTGKETFGENNERTENSNTNQAFGRVNNDRRRKPSEDNTFSSELESISRARLGESGDPFASRNARRSARSRGENIIRERESNSRDEKRIQPITRRLPPGETRVRTTASSRSINQDSRRTTESEELNSKSQPPFSLKTSPTFRNTVKLPERMSSKVDPEKKSTSSLPATKGVDARERSNVNSKIPTVRSIDYRERQLDRSTAAEDSEYSSSRKRDIFAGESPQKSPINSPPLQRQQRKSPLNPVQVEDDFAELERLAFSLNDTPFNEDKPKSAESGEKIDELENMGESKRPTRKFNFKKTLEAAGDKDIGPVPSTIIPSKRDESDEEVNNGLNYNEEATTEEDSELNEAERIEIENSRKEMLKKKAEKLEADRKEQMMIQQERERKMKEDRRERSRRGSNGEITLMSTQQGVDDFIVPDYINALITTIRNDKKVSPVPEDFLSPDIYTQWRNSMRRSFQEIVAKMLKLKYITGQSANNSTSLRLHVKECRGVIFKDGKARSMYTEITFGNLGSRFKSNDVFRTNEVESDQDPVWNQKMTIPVTSNSDQILLQVMDSKRDQFLGQTFLDISQIIRYCEKSGKYENWLELEPKLGKSKDKYIGGKILVAISLNEGTKSTVSYILS
jgi:hypothetical protein